MPWDSHASEDRARRSWLAGLAFLMVMGGAGPAAAAEPSRDAKQEAKARFVAGQSHYNLNEFPQALREFKEAYRLYPDPVFLFNLGQCERQLGHYEEAIRFYRSFLREQPKAPNRQDVLHKIEEMETAQKTKEAEGDKGVFGAPPSIEPGAKVPLPPTPSGLPAGTTAEPAKPLGTSPPSAAGAETPPSSVPAAPGPAAAVPGSPLPSPAPPAGAEPTGGVAAALDLRAAPAPEPKADQAPVYKRWWFWTAAAAVAVGAGVGIYAATASHDPAIPSSALGSRKVF